jgi:hypothetical protein
MIASPTGAVTRKCADYGSNRVRLMLKVRRLNVIKHYTLYRRRHRHIDGKNEVEEREGVILGDMKTESGY